MSNKVRRTNKVSPGNSFPIFVIGASAGGLNAVSEVVAQIDEEMNAAVFVVIHLSRTVMADFFLLRLKEHAIYECVIPADGQEIKPRTIYLAPTDIHLVIDNDKIILGKGPAENRWRPSIDVLFRSAAASYDGRVTGIVLTGLMDDGTAGMGVIKKCGGTTVVQDPNEAEFPDMPLSVLNNMQVDYCVPLAGMGNALKEITNKPYKKATIPAEIRAEAAIAQHVSIGIDKVRELGEQSLFSCPDCGGMLWEIKDQGFHRYRCHIGHGYSQRDLLVRQRESLEATLWISLRMLEERRNLMMKVEAEHKRRGLNRLASTYHSSAEEILEHIENLKTVLFSAQEN
jgi:two-component system chemotaxis response regulator CheB